jgi:predicted transcriptional regulator of viral defense system
MTDILFRLALPGLLWFSTLVPANAQTISSTCPNWTLPKGRVQFATLLRAAGDIVHVDDAERSLGLPRAQAAKRLSRWMAQGWLQRVGPGAYAPVAIDTIGADQVLSDPWVLVPALFSPGYVGGRTAAEHWDLTE